MAMDPGTAFVVLAVIQLGFVSFCYGNFVFEVQHKFAGTERSLSAFKAHDALRHSRILSAVDLPLGGSGHPAEAGLYFAKIGLGNPSKDYYVQVDTGSDLLWVNCINCDKCPTKSDLGVTLTLYDPKSSASSSRVYCSDDFCTSTYNGILPGCTKELPCQYNVVYGDGSSTAGYFIRDAVQLIECGAKQSGELGTSSEALDGILGFGQANSSMISQLASAGKVKGMFAHCLDRINGGGIFAIGEVVSPKVNTTPMVPNQAHYNVVIKDIEVGDAVLELPSDTFDTFHNYNCIDDFGAHYNVVMKDIEVGDAVLELPSDTFDTGDQSGTIIDSGTTLAYLPDVVYNALMTKILDHQPGLRLRTVEEQFTCLQYSGNVDDGFPVVKFHFEDSLTLTVDPHEYLFQIREDIWCFGWQNSGMQSKDGRDMTLLGDLVLSNKLVLYDLENQAIGWTEYNCSSTIKVKDESSGSVYSVGAHDLSSASGLINGRTVIFLLLVFAMFHRFI